MSIDSVMPSSHPILCRPLLLLPPIPPSIRVFSNESTLHMRWPKYWSFSFSIIPSKEIPGLISFRMDWLDLLAVQEIRWRDKQNPTHLSPGISLSFTDPCMKVTGGGSYLGCGVSLHGCSSTGQLLPLTSEAG